MQIKILCVIAAVTGLCLSGSQTALAQPMRCSGEEKTCIAICMKSTNRSYVANCITSCHTRLSVCKQTGCWDSGTRKYCGLTRQ
jgi:hypothetical protein